MRINIKELENVLCANLANNQYLVGTPILIESWEVSPYDIRRVLLDKNKSPYFYPLYKGVFKTNDFSFYGLCFYAFMSGVEYALIKNNNKYSKWDYWTMHRNVGDELSIQALSLWKGLQELNPLMLGAGGYGHMGSKGKMAYSIVSMVIDAYFGDKGVEDFEVLDEDGYETKLFVSNVPEVLSSFHRIGTICAFQVFAMSKTNEKEADEYILWGGVGMAKFIQYT